MPEPSEVQDARGAADEVPPPRHAAQHDKLHHHHHGAAPSPSPSVDRLSGSGSEGSGLGSLAQANTVNGIQSRWCCGEDAELFCERWEKLFAEFCDGEKVDPSKISELYDTMKFDALHNRAFLEWVFTPPKHMLDEDWAAMNNSSNGGGGGGGNNSARQTAALADEGRLSEDSRAVAGGAQQQPPQQPAADEKDRPDRPSSDVAAKTVKRIFRRRSWMASLRHSGDQAPEHYFNLYRGNNQSKAMTDARLEPLRELYQLAKILFDFICPQEYGISDSEKVCWQHHRRCCESMRLSLSPPPPPPFCPCTAPSSSNKNESWKSAS